jgi:predicted NBD/HSP70 family sugar kinase
MYVAIDVGGTKTLVASLDSEGKIKQQAQFPTPATYQDLVNQIGTSAAQLNGDGYRMAAAGVPGILDRQKGTVLSYGHREWVDTPIRADLSKALGCPALIENDGKLGGLVEAVNLINEYKDMLYLAIGTGIGICYTSNGIIDQSISDGGGHTMMLEHEGKTQAWEDFAGGQAIVTKYGQRASQITDPETWKAISHNLSLGIVELLKNRSADVIVIGGGVGAHLDKFKSFLEVAIKDAMGSCPPLIEAQHPEQAVIYGAYQLIKQHEQHGKAPSHS